MNVAVIVAAAWSLASAVWGAPPEALEEGARDLLASNRWLWGAYAVGGVLGFAAVFSAVRRPGLARGLTLLAGLVVLSGFLALRTVTFVAALSLAVPALVFLAAVPLIGPMPRPEDEERGPP